MKSSNYQAIRTSLLGFGYKMLKNKPIYLILMASTMVLLFNNAFSPQPILAQDVIAQSPSLNKNQNTIYVNPKRGDDSQLGKKASPLKTITQALAIAAPNTTIQLAAGIYSEDSGETFPLIIKDEITLQGNSDNQGYGTIIEGSGYFVSPTAAGQNVTLVAIKNAGSIMGVTVTNQHSRGYGLWIESANPQVIANTFTRSGNTGVSVNGNSSPRIENNYFYNNSGNGLLVDGTSAPEVLDNTFEQTGFGVSIIEQATAMLTKNIFDGNRIGIILESSSQGILRDNEIINSSESGLTAIAQSRVDLGTDGEPGNNVFRSNQKLDIHNATKNEIPAVGTQVQGDIIGDINFDRGTFVAKNQDNTFENNPFKDLPPLPREGSLNNRLLPESSLPQAAAPSNLPAPPPVINNTKGNKELVFTPSSNSTSTTANLEPVPFPPEIKTTSSSYRASLVKYKVLVEALDQREEAEVRSLYPEAFKTIYKGESWLQVGAFSNLDKAKRAERTLVDLGLETYLID